jgi:hypothetical protein
MKVTVRTTDKDGARKMLDDLLEARPKETPEGLEVTLPEPGNREAADGEGQFLRILCLYGLRVVI